MKIIKAVKPIHKENCCGKRVKKTERKKINYKRVIKKETPSDGK